MPVELARAKVNLSLHVTGQREDGMHLLDSIVVFPEVGDELQATTDKVLTLEIDGQFGVGLDAGEDNLIIRAARLLSDKGARLQLRKNLPVAAGIGGGSADAAACIRLLANVWDLDTPAVENLATLGADVPVCLAQVSTRMSGIGEKLTSLPPLPRFWIVLVNTGQGVETGAVFRAMKSRDNAVMLDLPEDFQSAEELFSFLRAQRNDMQSAAIENCPEIADVLRELEVTDKCALARMSGSGGTCFGLYATKENAVAATNKIGANQPDWWVVSAQV